MAARSTWAPGDGFLSFDSWLHPMGKIERNTKAGVITDG